jgi:TPR repeat protein
VALLQRGCELGDLPSCHNLGLMHFYGLGIPKDAARATFLFRSACDKADGAACNALGFAYETGQGAEKNVDKARELYEYACFFRERDDGCANLGVWLETHGGDPKSAARNYANACHDESRDCKLLEPFRRDCKGGEIRACTLAGALGRPSDRAAATESLKRGCDGGDAAACMLLKKM